jgi:hypothetical protein
MPPRNHTDGPVHAHAGLSYSTHFVVPRTLAQSMPIDWQLQFVECLEQLVAAYRHLPQPEAYDVIAGREVLVGEMDGTELRAAGITEDWYGGETAPAGLAEVDLIAWRERHEQDRATFYDADGNELDRDSRVVIPMPDPIPHYNRGRTYLPPDLGDDAEPDAPPHTVTVQLRVPLPVPVRDFPALTRTASRAAAAHGVNPAVVTMAQDGADLVLSYEVNPS